MTHQEKPLEDCNTRDLETHDDDKYIYPRNHLGQGAHYAHDHNRHVRRNVHVQLSELILGMHMDKSAM